MKQIFVLYEKNYPFIHLKNKTCNSKITGNPRNVVQIEIKLSSSQNLSQSGHQSGGDQNHN
jgi:hypothetical protein